MSSRQLLLLCLPAVALAIALPAPSRAQGVDCTVNVNYEAVTGTYKDLLRNFASDVKEYVNSYQWGAENVPDKVKCTLDIFIQGVTGDNQYNAQVFIGSQRPVYKSNKSTAVLRLKDDAWQFVYIKGRPINHNPMSFSDLASFLDFYMYLIVGYDSDTYDRDGGSIMLQHALDISRMGKATGQTGWQAATTGYSRSQFIDEIMLPKSEALRSAYYIYHYAGLDSMAIDQDRGRSNVLAALDMVGKVRNDLGGRNLVIKSFFDTKYQEIAQLFSAGSDRSVFVRLSSIDPNHIATYEEYRTKP
ncbi:MAG TPA: DUF4835 family protein [Bacteroidota bacterium]